MSAPLPVDGSARSAEHASTAAVLGAAAERLAAASDTPKLDAELLLSLLTGRARASLLAFPERLVEPEIGRRFAELVARRASGEPLAYLTGEREFFSLTLTVSDQVLIPRPETELLVEALLARCAAIRYPAVLDLATGSGAIALAAKHALPGANVTGADVSAGALAVARSNGARLGLDVRWVESEWLAAFSNERFDFVVSNPPYVRSTDVRGALAREPSLALDGGSDGLDAYRVLFAAAPQHLNDGGALLVEHGADQRADLIALAEMQGWRVAAVRDDLAGRARVLELERSAEP
jgi:release factor glutamine methyltransferase